QSCANRARDRSGPTRECDDDAREQGCDGEQHYRAVRHHHGPRDVIACEATRMPCEHVETAVSDAELLLEVPAHTFTPPVDADRVSAKREAVPGSSQPVAEIVVRS